MSAPLSVRRLMFAPVALLAGGLLTGCRSDTVWSPDSKSIALDTRGLLMTFDTGTRAFRKFPDPALKAVNPTWSPDGKTLLYYRARVAKDEVSALELAALDLAAGRSRSLVKSVPAPKAPAGEEGVLFVSNRLDLVSESISAAMSPDGKQIAYVGHHGQEPSLWLAAADGSGARELLEGRPAMRPVWSPDGKWLAFQGVVASSTSPLGADPGKPEDQPGNTLEIIAADGTGNKVLWKSDAKEKLAPMGPEPVWSADGKRLYAFTDIRPKTNEDVPNADLWAVPTDGGEAIKLNAEALPGPSMFASLTPNRLALFIDPENKAVKIPRLAFLDAPFATALRPLKLPTQFLGGDKPNQEVEGMPVPSLSPDGQTVAIAFVPKGAMGHLVLQPAGGGAAQRYPIPAPPATAAKPAPKKPAPKKPVAKPMRKR